MFITYESSQQAMRVYNILDNQVVFGRIIHIKPSLQDIGSIITNGKQQQYQKLLHQKYGNFQQQKSSYKKKKKRQMRQKLHDTTNWNTLFLNPNTILEHISKKLSISKSSILQSDNLAIKISLAQTQVIQQTKKWMQNQGLNLDFLSINRQLCQRSQTILLIKNLSYKINQNSLKELMQFYGIVENLILAPNKSIAIVKYKNSQYASNALQKLQHYKFKNNFLYLQYAPILMITQNKLNKKIKQIQQNENNNDQLSKIIYIKNLNFQTNEIILNNFISKISIPKSIKIIKNQEGKSNGYGFIQFQNHQNALQVFKKLQNTIIQGHKIIISMSKQKSNNFQKIKQLKNKINVQQIKNNKLLIKNIAFQASKNQIKQLFKQFGTLTKVRLPKKMNGQHRGFAFVEYSTLQDAALAKQALKDSHLYGRKLVIEYEKGNSI